MENRKLYIFGASGHRKVITELVANTNCKIEAFYDDAPNSDNFGLIPIFNSNEIVKPAADVALIIAIGNNTEKNKYFTLEQRKLYLEKTFAHLPKTEIAVFEGLTVNFC